jgi:hypothetical protein
MGSAMGYLMYVLFDVRTRLEELMGKLLPLFFVLLLVGCHKEGSQTSVAQIQDCYWDYSGTVQTCNVLFGDGQQGVQVNNYSSRVSLQCRKGPL